MSNHTLGTTAPTLQYNSESSSNCSCTKAPHPSRQKQIPFYHLTMASNPSPDIGEGLVRDVGNNSLSKALCAECEDIFSRWYERDKYVPKVQRQWHRRDRYIPKAQRPMYHSLRSLQS